MLENKLIIASAGSGKTTFLVKDALSKPDKNILITTFTLSNEKEIRNKIIEINRCIPKNITIKPWFTLLLEDGIRPYQGKFSEQRIDGLIIVNSQSAVRYRIKGIPIQWDEENNFLKHYFTADMKIFSDKLSKFVIRSNELNNGAVIQRLSKLYDYIFIDEVQDLAGYDLAIIKLLGISEINLTLVGDPRQVTYLTHNERKFSKYEWGKIVEFIKNEAKKDGWHIDDTSLNVSYRNNEDICSISSKLYPSLPSCVPGNKETTGHDGIFFLNKDEVNNYINEFRPVQLRLNRESQISNIKSEVYNFGESKGMTFNRVLIWPTKDMFNWFGNNDTELANKTRAQLYVALTRAKYSVAIVRPATKK